MMWFKRIGLFLLTNILVIATVSIIFNVLGVGNYITPGGIDFASLAVFCLIWGMVGSFISLFLSKWMAKWMMGLKVIQPNTTNAHEMELLRMVYTMAERAGLKKMPEVAMYDSPEVNAFATGATKSSSLVAVSTGLLHNMQRHEVEGVIGHEVAHIANGDMVTMTLIQGVVNAFVMFFARIIGFGISQLVDEDKATLVRIISTIILDILFSILASVVTAAFSRWREFRADEGGAQLAGRGNMIAALQALQRQHDMVDPSHASLATMKIAGVPKWLSLFSTHPPLEKRIAALQQNGR
jgi:heat shock protein HtpX